MGLSLIFLKTIYPIKRAKTGFMKCDISFITLVENELNNKKPKKPNKKINTIGDIVLINLKEIFCLSATKTIPKNTV